MAGGRPRQLSRNDWSFRSHCFRPWGPRPALVFIALLLHNNPKFGHHSSFSVKGDALALHQNTEWSVIARCLIQRFKDRGAITWVTASLGFCFQQWTLESHLLTPAAQSERWRSSKWSVHHVKLCLYEPLIWAGESFKHCAATLTIQGSVVSSANTKQQGNCQN